MTPSSRAQPIASQLNHIRINQLLPVARSLQHWHSHRSVAGADAGFRGLPYPLEPHTMQGSGDLDIFPNELSLTFERNKRASATVHLRNKCERAIKFSVEAETPSHHFTISPRRGVIQPHAVTPAEVAMVADNAPPSYRTHAFRVRSIAIAGTARGPSAPAGSASLPGVEETCWEQRIVVSVAGVGVGSSDSSLGPGAPVRPAAAQASGYPSGGEAGPRRAGSVWAVQDQHSIPPMDPRWAQAAREKGVSFEGRQGGLEITPPALAFDFPRGSTGGGKRMIAIQNTGGSLVEFKVFKASPRQREYTTKGAPEGVILPGHSVFLDVTLAALRVQDAEHGDSGDKIFVCYSGSTTGMHPKQLGALGAGIPNTWQGDRVFELPVFFLPPLNGPPPSAGWRHTAGRNAKVDPMDIPSGFGVFPSDLILPYECNAISHGVACVANFTDHHHEFRLRSMSSSGHARANRYGGTHAEEPWVVTPPKVTVAPHSVEFVGIELLVSTFARKPMTPDGYRHAFTVDMFRAAEGQGLRHPPLNPSQHTGPAPGPPLETLSLPVLLVPRAPVASFSSAISSSSGSTPWLSPSELRFPRDSRERLRCVRALRLHNWSADYVAFRVLPPDLELYPDRFNITPAIGVIPRMSSFTVRVTMDPGVASPGGLAESILRSFCVEKFLWDRHGAPGVVREGDFARAREALLLSSHTLGVTLEPHGVQWDIWHQLEDELANAGRNSAVTEDGVKYASLICEIICGIPVVLHTRATHSLFMDLAERLGDAAMAWHALAEEAHIIQGEGGQGPGAGLPQSVRSMLAPLLARGWMDAARRLKAEREREVTDASVRCLVEYADVLAELHIMLDEAGHARKLLAQLDAADLTLLAARNRPQEAAGGVMPGYTAWPAVLPLQPSATERTCRDLGQFVRAAVCHAVGDKARAGAHAVAFLLSLQGAADSAGRSTGQGGSAPASAGASPSLLMPLKDDAVKIFAASAGVMAAALASRDEDDNSGTGEASASDSNAQARRRSNANDEMEMHKKEWAQLKRAYKLKSAAMDELLKLSGLDAIKARFLNICLGVGLDKERGMSLHERQYNVRLEGNPGTGKTTVARLYARLLTDLGVFEGAHQRAVRKAEEAAKKAEEERVQKEQEEARRRQQQAQMVQNAVNAQYQQYRNNPYTPPPQVNVPPPPPAAPATPQPPPTPREAIVETTGAALSEGGIPELKKLLDKLEAGGLLFVDEAYQLNPAQPLGQGRQVLNLLLTEMENKRDSLAVAFAGYKKDMDKLFEFNEGLPRRFPETFAFEDYSDEQLMSIFIKMMADRVGRNGRYRFKDDDPKWAEVAIARLGRQRGALGFANAREVRNLFDRVQQRQASRFRHEPTADKFELTKEDLLGSPTVDLSKSAAWRELESMTGLKQVKESILAIAELVKTNLVLELEQRPLQQISLNKLFLGNPGTGKTTVAKLYGQILRDLGLLSKGEVHLKTASDFVGDVVGGSEQKTRALLDQAAGCVLLIDEAYGLFGTNGQDPFRVAVLNTIVEKVQNVAGEDRAVIMVGYREEMEKMLRDSNPGLARRFGLNDAFVFEDYDNEQLMKILAFKLNKEQLRAGRDARMAAIDELARRRDTSAHFGNGGEVDNLLREAKLRKQRRRSSNSTQARLDNELIAADFDPRVDEPVGGGAGLGDELFGDLIGMDEVATLLKRLQATFVFARNRGTDPLQLVSLNFRFCGPPGTGKTTVARRMGRMFCQLGVLHSEDVVQCSPSDFLTGYGGQAALKTKEMFANALGKVLFVDEAYGLNPSHGGGTSSSGMMQEVVDQMVQCLTDERFKGKMVVILAGYEADINALMAANAGLASRFPNTIPFRNFNAVDCQKLLCMTLNSPRYGNVEISPEALSVLPERLQRLVDLPNFGNGRTIDEWAKLIFAEVAVRAACDAGARVEAVDIDHSFDVLLQNMPPPQQPAVSVHGNLQLPHGARAKFAPAGCMAPPSAAPPAIRAATSAPAMASEAAAAQEQACLEMPAEEAGPSQLPLPVNRFEEMDPVRLGALQAVMDEVGMNDEEGARRLCQLPPGHEELAEVARKLATRLGVSPSEAATWLSKWQQEARRAYRDADDEKEKVDEARKEAEQTGMPVQVRVPLYRCAVCGRANQPFIACYVAPYVSGYMDITIAV
eukprot:jgi/Mesvir1/22684/Mv14107-RA.1